MLPTDSMTMTVPENESAELRDQLESLEASLNRLTHVLTSQEEAKRKRRRRLTMRSLLLIMVLFALAFTAFGRTYQRSRRQAAAVDRLLNHAVFIHYQPRQSAVISLLPGDPDSPPRPLRRWLGDDFFNEVNNVSTSSIASPETDKRQILNAIEQLADVERLRLTRLDLTTADLNRLTVLTQLKSLDVSRTRLDSGRLRWANQTQLTWFNGSHTWLGDQAAFDLAQCPRLQHLSLERTGITDRGLDHLTRLTGLRYLNLKRTPTTAEAVKRFSEAMPQCVIDWEPLKFKPDGSLDVALARRNRVRFGTPMPPDPRNANQPVAPSDSPNHQVYPPQFRRRSSVSPNTRWVIPEPSFMPVL